MTGSSQLFGREADLLALENTLTQHRFVTITGAPGVGKSALAAAHATRRSTICSLSEARDGTDGTRAIARALGVSIAPSADDARLAAQIGRGLAHRGNHLLVLDGADRCGAELGERIASWLREAPSARVLVTSRVRLEGERRIALAPLEVPAARVHDTETLAKNPAVRLFAKHAAAARAGFRVSDANARTLASIVRALEGLPLAIELCAARARTLSEGEIDELLVEQLDLLEDQRSGRSLRSALAFSWEDVADDDRQMLAACACFRGTFTIDAAGAVAGADASAKSRVRTALSIERLLDRSLVRMHDSAGAQRYALPSSVRAYALERVGQPTEAVLRARHAEYVASLETRALPVDALELDRESFEDALAYALEIGSPRVAARVVVALAPLVLARGPLRTFADDVARVAESDGVDDAERAELSYLRGLALVFAGRRDEALVELRRAQTLARERGDAPESRRVTALAASKVGLVLGMTGNLAQAHASFAEARKLATEPRDQAVVLKDFANVLSEEGKNDEAAEILSRARAMFHAAGDVREEGFVAMMLGTRLLDDGELVQARRDCTAALELLQRAGDRRSEAWTLAMLALIDSEEGKASAARERLDAALSLVRAIGDEHTEGLLLSFIGNVALEHGPLADAESAYRDAAVLLERAGDRGTAGLVAASAGVLDRELGREAAARAGFAHAEELLRGDGRAARAEAVAILKALDDRLPGPQRRVEEIRFARRVVRAVCMRRESAVSAPASTAACVVASDGSWVRLPNGETVRFSRSRALAAALLQLALERIRHPGRPVRPESLVRAAWPDERILPAAAKNRLHVTISRLRRLGLGRLVIHDPDGYLLDGAAQIRIAEPGERPDL